MTLVQKQENPDFDQTQVLGLPLLVAVSTYMINPQWMMWSTVPLPIRLRWLGASRGLVTIPLLFCTFCGPGPNVSETVLTKER